MLADLFNDSAMVRVLDFILDKPEFDFSKAEVARQSKLTWISVNNVFPQLEKLGMIRKTRNVNRAEMYCVVKDSKLLDALHKADLQLSLIVVKQLATKDIETEQKMTVKVRQR